MPELSKFQLWFGLELARTYKKAYQYIKKNDLDGALVQLNRVLELTPQNATAFFDCGTLRGMQGDHDGAIADLGEAIRIEPRYAQAYGQRARTYILKGDFKAALAQLDEAIQQMP